MEIHPDFKSDKWLNEISKLPPIEILKKNGNELLKTNFINQSFEEIQSAIQNKLSLIPIPIKIVSKGNINKLSVYRVRINIDSEKENSSLIKTYSYPPSFICKKNRANIEKYPVFYCSENKMTSLREMDPKANDIVYLSIWRFNSKRDVYIVPILPNNLGSANYWQPLAKDMHNYFSEFNKKVGENKFKELTKLFEIISDYFIQNNYPLTSWFANKYLYKTNNIDLILYPSFANSKKTCSIAIHPNFVDRYLELEKIYILKITEFVENGYKFQLQRIGILSYTNIIWKYPKKEDTDYFK